VGVGTAQGRVVLSVYHPRCAEPKDGPHQHVLPVVVVVRCAADGDGEGSEEGAAEQEEVQGGRRAPAPEGAELAGYVEEDEAPGGEGEGGVAGGEALPALYDGGRVATAGQQGTDEGLRGNVAVRPASL